MKCGAVEYVQSAVRDSQHTNMLTESFCMKTNNFVITDKMAFRKSQVPCWTWDEIISTGLKVAEILDSEDNKRKYNELYWLSQQKHKLS